MFVDIALKAVLVQVAIAVVLLIIDKAAEKRRKNHPDKEI
jgi:hypothetical protein